MAALSGQGAGRGHPHSPKRTGCRATRRWHRAWQQEVPREEGEAPRGGGLGVLPNLLRVSGGSKGDEGDFWGGGGDPPTDMW